MSLSARTLPALPLLLWKTPPALQMVLAQEGIAHRVIETDHPLAFRAGRFVLFDGRRQSMMALRQRLKPEHTPIDVRALFSDEPVDLFEALLETAGEATTWRLQHQNVTETVSRHDRAKLRRKIIGRLRDVVTKSGGVWARISPYPFPYRSAFNLRVDLDEQVPADYFAFADARTPIAEATTHFVSTHAYGEQPDVLADLRDLDTHSHGHYHVTYRDAEANRVNLRRALDRLAKAGITGNGFAAPHGRWNLGLNTELEELGCEFSSEFQVGYNDLPFYPWLGSRASKVLQIPVHPICEGLFFDVGAEGPKAITNHLVSVIAAKIAAGEPAFVYGHPERRLGRFPEIVTAIADAVAGDSLTWRVSLSTFAHWWKWRLARTWSLIPRGERSYGLQLDEWDGRYPIGLEVFRDRHSALVPIVGPLTVVDTAELAYERRSPDYALPAPLPRRRDLDWKAVIRRAIDWETVTPIEDLPNRTLSSQIKRELRAWRERSRLAG